MHIWLITLHDIDLRALIQFQFNATVDYFGLLLDNSHFWKSAKQPSGFGFVTQDSVALATEKCDTFFIM